MDQEATHKRIYMAICPNPECGGRHDFVSKTASPHSDYRCTGCNRVFLYQQIVYSNPGRTVKAWGRP
ncbi:MAG: hypothetical protein ISS48_03845 [Candidatus Aenigmarchaeota archaeon]|nr:hypothetical protein [Candidatus Aenigmarchaeota archaeon]